MKKIFVFLAPAYAFTTGMAAATVLAHTEKPPLSLTYSAWKSP
jgi:hypothetical protein